MMLLLVLFVSVVSFVYRVYLVASFVSKEESLVSIDDNERDYSASFLRQLDRQRGTFVAFKKQNNSQSSIKTDDDDDDDDDTVVLSSQGVNNNNTLSSEPTATVGYAISLIKCPKKETFEAGLIDAALMVQHSVHMQSIRNPKSGSKYDYKMYAIVHKDAEACSSILRDVGFEIMIVDTPVYPQDIKGRLYLRKQIANSGCCGHHEFVKLYMYKIPQPIVVHVDIDFAFYKPMDELYDAILFDKDSPEGKTARSTIPIEQHLNNKWPEGPVNAMFTKDWPQAFPGRKAGFQAGFIVIRGNQTQVFDELVEIIKEGNYKKGYGIDNGWGGAGYGSFVGAMTMQGLIAYYYDMHANDTFVELNQCRYNWMGIDVRYRRANRKDLHGKCRNKRWNDESDQCEDCRHTDWSLIKNVHYTHCWKPWSCIGDRLNQSMVTLLKIPDKNNLDENAGSLESCLKVHKEWHALRIDFEDKLYKLTKDDALMTSRNGTYKKEHFMGHCNALHEYNQIMVSNTSTYKQVKNLYDTATNKIATLK